MMSPSDDVERLRSRVETLTAQVQRLEADLAASEVFIQRVCHDLHEPLRAVRSFGELIGKRYADAFDDTGRRHLGYMVEGATQAKSLLDRLSMLRQISTRTLRRQRVDLALVVREALASERVDAENIAAFDIDESVALPQLIADYDSLKLVFAELISNAICYGGQPKAKLTLAVQPEGPGWSVALCNDGLSVPAGREHELFEPLVRERLPDRSCGTGIGLALCRIAIERQGGSIKIAAVPGGGSCCTLWLPSEARLAVKPRQPGEQVGEQDGEQDGERSGQQLGEVRSRAGPGVRSGTKLNERGNR